MSIFITMVIMCPHQSAIRCCNFILATNYISYHAPSCIEVFVSCYSIMYMQMTLIFGNLHVT